MTVFRAIIILFARAGQPFFRYTKEIPMPSSPHRATVDADGNIILPSPEVARVGQSDAQVMEESVWYQATGGTLLPWEETVEEELIMESIDETAEESAATQTYEPVIAWEDVRSRIVAVTSGVLCESGNQYRATVKDTMHAGRGMICALRSLGTKSWTFLTQPVWIPGRRNEPRQYGRGALFLLDSVRFGGTFAALFALLFVSLNFQSFWTIAQSYVDPLHSLQASQTLTADLDNPLTAKLKRVPSLAVSGVEDRNLLDFLPPVGPPENRLIIPKLNLNIPIVVPPNDALMREDWKVLEEDIQYGLQDGVVHYPGSARPGQPGNFFVTGHSSYFPWAPGNFKSVFARLGELQTGDEYWVYYGGDKYRYVIREKKEIRPSDVDVLRQPLDRRISTLMTCTPVGTTLRRLIISAQEVDPITGINLEVGEHHKGEITPRPKMEMLPI